MGYLYISGTRLVRRVSPIVLLASALLYLSCSNSAPNRNMRTTADSKASSSEYENTGDANPGEDGDQIQDPYAPAGYGSDPNAGNDGLAGDNGDTGGDQAAAGTGPGISLTWTKPTEGNIDSYTLRVKEGPLAGWEKKFEVGKDIDPNSPKIQVRRSDDQKLQEMAGSEVCFVLVATNLNGPSQESDKICEVI